jgi:hypothetical protein
VTPAELRKLADAATDIHYATVSELRESFERLAGMAPDLARLAADMAEWIDTVLAQGAPVTSDYETGPALLARLEMLT